MATVTVYLGLGSNLGDRRANLLRGIEFLRKGIQISRISPIDETEPVGYTEQPPFLNGVCQGETNLAPLELLSLAKEAEAALGRQPTFRNGPRTLDVDILFYGDQVVSEEAPLPKQGTLPLFPDSVAEGGLEVPHPRLTERRFVLEPLASIAPDLRHPVSGVTVKEMFQNLMEEGDVPPGPNRRKWTDIEVTVVRVIDGDSLMVRYVDGGPPFELRLHGIDAREYDQSFGEVAKTSLQRLTANRRFRLSVIEPSDRYNRSVGILYSQEHSDSINHQMVEAGMAYAYPPFGSLNGISACRQRAKKNKLGIWAQLELASDQSI